MGGNTRLSARQASADAGTFLFNTNFQGETRVSSHRRGCSKRELPGSLYVDSVMSVCDLGLVPGTNRWEVLRAFLKCGEGRAAERTAEARHGFLALQSTPGRRNTGAIYTNLSVRFSG